MTGRGQGAFEYLLLLGGTVLVTTIVLVMTQGSIQNANNTFGASTNDYTEFVKGGVKDVLANGSIVHEQPTGCMYSNPACDAGYYCDNGVCRQANALLKGYTLDPSGNVLSGVTIHIVGGSVLDALTSASGYYEMPFAVNGSSATYSVTAARNPANVQSGATVNLTSGFATIQNFTLSYNPAALSGLVRDSSNAGINGATVNCAGKTATTAGGGAYSISGIAMTSATTTCTLSASKSSHTSASATASLSAGMTSTGQNLTINLIVAGACGSSNGLNFSSAPSTGLCAAGAASAVTDTGSWKWFCNGSYGGTNASCSANKAVNGVCGSSNGASFYSVPTLGFCSAGTTSAVSGSGPWSWNCAGLNSGTASGTCTANKKVDGVCGGASGTYYASAPTSSLCNYGTPSASGSWSWSCYGLNGGAASATCTAYQRQSCSALGGTMTTCGTNSCCRMPRSSCPVGWSSAGYTTTTSSGCVATCNGPNCYYCNMGSAGVSYVAGSGSNYYYCYESGSHSWGAGSNSNEWAAQGYSCSSPPWYHVTYSTITEIGCW